MSRRTAGFKEATAGSNIELVDVRGDDIDMARARANVDDTLAANPEINCMEAARFSGIRTGRVIVAAYVIRCCKTWSTCSAFPHRSTLRSWGR